MISIRFRRKLYRDHNGKQTVQVVCGNFIKIYQEWPQSSHKMKLNHDAVLKIPKIELKALQAVELLSKNHKIAPIEKIKSISQLSIKFDTVFFNLCKSKFLFYETLPYLGYELTVSGYDCIAINSLRSKGLQKLGDKIGIGKESDIFYGEFENKEVVLKFHRIGRTSFKTAKNNRDYLQHRKHASWLYFSKLSAEKEFGYMNLLKNFIDIPQPIINNRHIVVMEYLQDYIPLYTTKNFDHDKVYCLLMDSIKCLWHAGYVHGDFNEFNIMIDKESNVKIIDFPQMVSTDHPRAQEYLQRDINCIRTFFEKKLQYKNDYIPDGVLKKLWISI